MSLRNTSCPPTAPPSTAIWPPACVWFFGCTEAVSTSEGHKQFREDHCLSSPNAPFFYSCFWLFPSGVSAANRWSPSNPDPQDPLLYTHQLHVLFHCINKSLWHLTHCHRKGPKNPWWKQPSLDTHSYPQEDCKSPKKLSNNGIQKSFYHTAVQARNASKNKYQAEWSHLRFSG